MTAPVPTAGGVVLAVCEIGKATGSGQTCTQLADTVARLAHVGGSSRCTMGDFSLCSRHLDAIRGEVAAQLASVGPNSKCSRCGAKMRAVSDVVGSVVSL